MIQAKVYTFQQLHLMYKHSSQRQQPEVDADEHGDPRLEKTARCKLHEVLRLEFVGVVTILANNTLSRKLRECNAKRSLRNPINQRTSGAMASETYYFNELKYWHAILKLA